MLGAPRFARAGIAAVLSASGLVAVFTVLEPAASATEVIPLPSSGNVALHVSGNGHGHGMSQYGARGAAIAGLTTPQILAFYYPGTTLTTIPATTLRVKLSDATGYTTVFGAAGMSVTGVPSTMDLSVYQYVRAVPSGSGVVVEGYKKGATGWDYLSKVFQGTVTFSNKTTNQVRVLMADQTSTSYYGTISTPSNGADDLTINNVALDQDTEGVAPREMPASWQSSAVFAQAIAARTYAMSERTANSGNSYDICDNTDCQVYGGHIHYSSSGAQLWTDDPAAVSSYANQILTTGNPATAIFAQFSASNGGALVAGGKPYLVSKADPYDDAASGDPYLNVARTPAVSGIDSYFGLRTATTITITQRDGYGPYGGRVLSAVVAGVTSSGVTTTVQATGFDLEAALDLPTTLFRFDTIATAPSVPTSVTATGGPNGTATIRWAQPANTGSSPVTSYHIVANGHAFTASASATSVVVSPINELASQTVTVSAVNAVGSGPAAAVPVTATITPLRVTPLQPARVFSGVTVSAGTPYFFHVPGAGGVPASGVTSVQMVIGVIGSTGSGILHVRTSSSSASPASAITYSAGQLNTATVSVPLTTSTQIALTPTVGTVRVYGAVEAYTSASGLPISMISPMLVANAANISTTTPMAVPLDSVPGIASAKGVLLSVEATGPSSPSGSVTVWPAGYPRPPTTEVAVGPTSGRVNTLIVPFGPSQSPSSRAAVLMAANVSGVNVKVTVLGLIGAGAGGLVTFQPEPVADPAQSGQSPLTVGNTTVGLTVGGHAQVPSSGVAGVLLQLTVSSSAAGGLWLNQPGAARAAAPAVLFGASGAKTVTALVRTNGAGAVSMFSSVTSVKVSVDVIGYVTAG